MTKRILSFCLSVILLVSMMSVCGLVLPVMAVAKGDIAYVATTITVTHEKETIMADVPYNFTYVATGLAPNVQYRLRLYNGKSWNCPVDTRVTADANGTVTFNLKDVTLAEGNWNFVCHGYVDGVEGNGVVRESGGGWLGVNLTAKPGVYVDSKNVYDTTRNGTLAAPYTTLAEAISTINASGYAGARVIYHVDSGWNAQAFSPNLSSLDSWTQPIEMRSNTSGKTIWFSGDTLVTKGPLHFERTTLGYGANGGILRINANLQDITFADDVKFSNSALKFAYGYNTAAATVSTEDLKTQDLNFTLSALNFPSAYTLSELSFGGFGSSTGYVTMKNANIVLDDGDVTIGKLIIGSISNQWIGNAPANVFTGNFNLTVNDIAGITEIANGDNASKRIGVYGAMQFVFNNGTGDNITMPTFGENSGSNGHLGYANGGIYVVRSEKKDGCYLEMTDTAGVYTVHGGKIATAVSADGSKTYVSGNGVLTIPTAGDYTVTYGDPTAIYVDFANGSDTANDGFSPDTALKTIVAAINKVNAEGLTGDNRKVVVVGDGQSNLDMRGVTPYTENITLYHLTTNGTFGAGTIWLNDSVVRLGGPLTINSIVGRARNQALTIYTYGYDLVLAEKFQDSYCNTNAENKKPGTQIYAGFDYAAQSATTEIVDGRFQSGRDNKLIFRGTQPGTVSIYYGQTVSYKGTYRSVQYGDGELIIDNPNLTVSVLELGMNGTSQVNNDTTDGGRSEALSQYKSLKIQVNNVASIASITIRSHQGGVGTNLLQVIFNNGTYGKITNAPTFNWATTDWTKGGFVTSNGYVLKSDATEGSSLDFTSTPGTYAVTSGLTANATDGTDTIYAQGGKLTVPKGVYDVTYSNKVSDLDGSTVTVPAGGQTIAVNTPPAKLPIAVSGDGKLVAIAGRHLVDPQAPVKNYTNTDYTDYITYRKPLTNTYNKIITDKKLTVSFMGGSVTIGTGANNVPATGWAQRSEAWFREHFPTDDGYRFTFKNVGSGESGTYLGTYRVAQDVISQNPDLFVIEYAINDYYFLGDGYDSTTGEFDPEKAAAAQKQAAAQYETIIREVKAALPYCDIVTVLTTDQNVHERAKNGLYDTALYPTAAGHAVMAEKYNISVVNVGESLADYIDENGEAWGDYFGSTVNGAFKVDVVHPNDAGYAKYAACFNEYLANELLYTDYTGVTGGRDVLIPVQSESLLDGDRQMIIAGGAFDNRISSPNVTENAAFKAAVKDSTDFEFKTDKFQSCYSTVYWGSYGAVENAQNASITFEFTGTEFAFWNNYYGLNKLLDSNETNISDAVRYSYTVYDTNGAVVTSAANIKFKSHAPTRLEEEDGTVLKLPYGTYTVTITPSHPNAYVIKKVNDVDTLVEHFFCIGAIFTRNADEESKQGDVDYYADGVDCMSLTLPEGNWTIQFLDADATVADLPLPTVEEGKTLLGWYNENSEKLEDTAALPAGSVLTAVIAEDGHEHNYERTYDDTQHWKECSCGLLEGEKANHNFSDWETTRVPSTTEAGEKQRSCECGKVETQSIPMLEVPADAIYVDGTNGDDENSGASAEKAVKTIAAAIAKIEAQGLTGDKRTIIVVNAEATYSLDLHSVATYTEMITLVTADPEATIKMPTGTVALAGPMTINAKIGNAEDENASYIFTRGFELVLGELFEDVYYDTYYNHSSATNVTGGGSTTIAIGYMPTYDPLDSDGNKVIQFGKDISLTVLGNKSYAVSIFVGNSDTVGNPVQYGDAYVYLNNPNLTVKTFDFGNRGTYTNTSSDWSKHNRFDDLKVVIDQVAVIEKWQVNNFNNAVATNTLQVLFNNNTYAKTTFDSNFSWHAGYPNAAFNSNKRYIMKSAATDGSKLQLTDTVGTFEVVGANLAQVTDGTNTYKSGNGKVAVGAVGIFDVTYPAPTAIYVSNDTKNSKVGDDANDGFSASAPLKTLQAAVNKANELGLSEIIVVACGWAEMSMDFSGCTPWTENITLTCENPGTTIWMSSKNIILNGPMTINAIVGDAEKQGDVKIYTRGYGLELGERYINTKYTEKGSKTIIYAGFDYAAQSATTEIANGRYQLGATNNLIITGTKKQAATIYYGHTVEYLKEYRPVQYSDGNLVIDNPNLTIDLLQFGINGTSQVKNDLTEGGKYEALCQFNSFKFQVNNVAAISNVKVGSYQGGVGASSVQAIFNNGTYENVIFASFNWATGDWKQAGFVTSKAYVVKSGADGYLDFTETPGTFAVTADKSVAVATLAGSSATHLGSATLTVPSANGVYTVTYSEPNGVYVDFTNGSAANDGLTPNSPLNDLAAAIEKLNVELQLTGENRKIYVVKDKWESVNMSNPGLTAWEEPITIENYGSGNFTLWLSDRTFTLNGPLNLNVKMGYSITNDADKYFSIQTNGYALTLGDKFLVEGTAGGSYVNIYTGYNHAYWAMEPVEGVINYGKDVNLTVKGSGEYAANIYVGNNFGGYQDASYNVYYGNMNVVLDNPNLTVKLLQFGNQYGQYAIGAGSSGRQNVFANVNFTVKNVNAINLVTSHTHNNASEVTGKLVAVFSNDTFNKTTFDDDFKWHAGYPNAGFHCGTYNVLKSAVTSGAYLTAGDVPGFVNVVSDLPATAESDSVKLTSEDGVLSNLPNGVYDVKYYQVVYVDAENGDDENDGLTASSAVKTIGKAMAIINGDYVGERVVYMVKTTTDMSGNFTTAGKYDEPITVRGKTASDTIWVSDANVILAGPVIFEQTRIGFVNAETTLNFHANGHVLKVTETVIIPNPVSIVAGVHGGYKEFGGNVMHVEFAGQLMKRAENDIVPTITEIVMAGEANKENPQRFTYAYAYLNIDNANVAVGRIRLGYEHVANNASPVPSDGNYSLPNSVVAGDFTVYLNAASLGGIAFPSHHNGTQIFGDLQIVLNNGIGNSLTVANHRDIVGFTVIGKQLVLRSEAADGCRLETSTKVGTYRVIGNRVAVATDGETVYRSKNGDLAVTEGDYVVTYEPIGEYFFVGDVLTAVTDLNNVDISDVALTQDGNRILLGWTLADGTPVADVTNVTISAGETLKAVYGDFNVSYESGNADFFIEGVQMRATNSQGLRFVFTKGTNFDAKFEAVSGVKHGYVLLPKQKLVGELTVNTAGAVTKDNSNNGFVYFDESGDRYTVCLTNIAKEYYNTVYVARGYTTYTDINGAERTVYTEQYACSLFEAAALTLSEADAGHITLDAVQRGKVVKVLADYRSHAKQNSIDKINNVADTLTTQGTTWYISEKNGSLSGDGSFENPWKTIGQLNAALENKDIESGDLVLFERGGEYRLNSVSYGIKAYLVNGVSYGAYGTGAKPVINGSVKNYKGDWVNAGDGLWTLTLTDIVNIYVDPGVIVFDGGRAVGARQKNFADVTKNYDFSWQYNNNGTGTITLRYDGDLNADFTSIEIGTDLRLLDICTDQWAASNDLDSYTKADYISNMVIENLEFRNSGGFGVRASNNVNITVRGCTFYYIGGSYDVASDETDYEANPEEEYTRYGNAVEFMQNSENILVDRCYMEEIYDTAATFQGGKEHAMTVKDFTMINCVTVNCGLAGFEYWMGAGSVATGVTIKNNYMEGTGCGWGGEQRPIRDHAAHIRSTRATEEVYDFVIAGNFFDGTNFTHEVDGSHALILASNLSLSPELQRNVYIDSSSASLGRLEFGYGNLEFEQHLYDEDARQTLKNVFGDTAPIVIFTESLA